MIDTMHPCSERTREMELGVLGDEDGYDADGKEYDDDDYRYDDDGY